MQSRSTANKCSLKDIHRGPVFGGKLRIKRKPESFEAKEKMRVQSPRVVCSVSRGEHESGDLLLLVLRPEIWPPPVCRWQTEIPWSLTLAGGLGQARRRPPFHFFTSDDIFSDPLPLKGFFPHLHTSPLCLLCFNLIINSNVSLHENFLFQIRPRDEVLPFILPGEWYITKTTPSLEYIKTVGTKTLSLSIPFELDYKLSL